MAAIFIIAGGIVGFASGVASLFLLGTSVLTALAIWSGVGLLMLIIGTVFAMLPRRESRQPSAAQSAL